MLETRYFRQAILLPLSLGLSCTSIGCAGRSARPVAPILLFAGTGTSRGDVEALETILDANRFQYATVSSTELNAMRAPELETYRLLIVPGGNFVDMGNSLTPGTAAGIHAAVQNGVNYLGVCAGAFLAGSLPAPYRSMNLTSGRQFGFYSAVSSTHKAVVPITPDALPTIHFDAPR